MNLEVLHDEIKDLEWAGRKEKLDAIPEETRTAYWAWRTAQHFLPENRGESYPPVLSSSGKYKLVVTRFNTAKGSWNYTQGDVYLKDSDTPVATVQRNYSSFPFLFVEDHPNGHDYLVCGEDYQGQTVVELDTGKRRDHLSEDAKQGHGFCWTGMVFDVEHKLLHVEGCIWACPYEYRYYDFVDPMSGWPQLGEDIWIDADMTRPTFEADGTLKVYQTQTVPDDDEDSPNMRKAVGIAAWTKYRREGVKLVEVESWVSDDEQERRRKSKAAGEAYEAWLKEFRLSDPLYLAMLEGLKDPVFTPEEYMSIGITYPNWCPTFDKEESRICRRIHKHKGKLGFTADLEWGAKTGPVKLELFKDGKTFETKFWNEHSVESIQAAFAYAKQVMSA